MANVNINWATTQSGVTSGGWVISNNGNGAGTRIRFNMETSSNCGGTNSSTQSGVATATIVPVGVNYDMSVALSGVGEAQDPGFEAITLTIDTPDLDGTIYTAAASGGGRGCATAPVTITNNIPGPYYLPANTTNILTINFSSRDSLFHDTSCFYQIDLSFESVDPPTNIRFFRANDQWPDTAVIAGEPVVLTWDTTWNGQSSAYTAVVDNGIGALTPMDGGALNLVPSPTITTTYTLTVTGSTGTKTQTVTVNVIPPDNQADPFAFGAVEEAEVSTVYDSNVVTISGLQIQVQVNATNGALISVNGGPFALGPQNIDNDDILQIRMTSSAFNNAAKTTSVSVGVTTTNWKITTKALPQEIPNNFDFNDVEEAPLQTYVESNPVTITGINSSVTVTSPTNGFESSVNGGAFDATPKSISNGQTLKLRVLTSNILGDTKTTQITVGGSPVVDWNVVNVLVADSNPNYFDFLDRINQPAGAFVESIVLTITGINVPTPVTVTNGAQFRINGGSWVTSGNINVNQTLQIRILSSSDPGGKVSTNVTVGNLTDLWQVFTTTDGDTFPDAFYFINKNDQPPNTLIFSNTVLITGITAAATVGITNGECSINNGPWVTTGTVNNNQTLRIRMISAPTVSTPKTVGISIG